MSDASLSIYLNTVNNEVENFNEYSKILFNLLEQVKDIKKNIALKNNISVEKSLDKCQNDLDNEINKIKEVSKIISEITKLYKDTESKIVGTEKNSKQKISSSDYKGNDSNENDKKSIEDKIKDEFHLSDDEWKTIEVFIDLLIGCIPGINCIYDVYNLVKDYNEAKEDGNVTNTEKVALLLDAIALATDTVTVFPLCKNAVKGYKEVKLAKTVAKSTKEGAEAAAKTAAKREAKKAVKDAKKWSKIAEKRGRSAVRREAEYKAARERELKSIAKKCGEQCEKNVADIRSPQTAADLGVNHVVRKEVEKEREN